MIYSTNRISSLGIGANPRYYGAGAFNFLQECAKDELDIFENAITTDMNEVILGESSYEMETINEDFFENVFNKIKEILKKFKEWIQAVTRSAIAKLASLLIRDNKEFAKFARKKMNDMKNKGKFEYNGTYLKLDTINSVMSRADLDSSTITEIKNAIEKAIDNRSVTFVKDNKNENSTNMKVEKALQTVQDMNVSDMMDECTDSGDLNFAGAMAHLKFLETLGKKELDALKKDLKKEENYADKLINRVEKLERDFNKQTEDSDKNSKDYVNATKDSMQALSTFASHYKTIVQTLASISLSLIKSVAKVARTVVTKAAGASPKNEGYAYDSVMIDAMNEAVLYEYDQALESMSDADNEQYDDIDEDDE